jgi:hypothetical protein
MHDWDTVELSKKLVWERENYRPRSLTAKVFYDHGAITPTGLTESDMDVIQEWCKQNKCGRRISFDTFLFATEQDISLFLLRWS